MAHRQIRPIRVDGNIAHVDLGNGRFAVIDAEDIPIVDVCVWRMFDNVQTVYAVGNVKVGHRQYRHTRMHRLIMAAPADMHVDHINHDGLDNRKANLRLVTNAENHQNQKRRSDCKSGVKGVCWDKDSGKWRAQIRAHGVRYPLGRFDSLEDAAAAYAEASARLHGEYGRLE